MSAERRPARAWIQYAAVVRKEVLQTLRDRRVMFMLIFAPDLFAQRVVAIAHCLARLALFNHTRQAALCVIAHNKTIHTCRQPGCITRDRLTRCACQTPCVLSG